MQAIGYVAVLARAPMVHASPARVLVGLGLAALTAVLAASVWRFARRKIIRRDLVALVRWNVTDLRDGPTLMDRPDLLWLAGYGRASDDQERATEQPPHVRQDMRLPPSAQSAGLVPEKRVRSMQARLSAAAARISRACPRQAGPASRRPHGLFVAGLS
jgi:hypothetical protein